MLFRMGCELKMRDYTIYNNNTNLSLGAAKLMWFGAGFRAYGSRINRATADIHMQKVCSSKYYASYPNESTQKILRLDLFICKVSLRRRTAGQWKRAPFGDFICGALAAISKLNSCPFNLLNIGIPCLRS